MNEDGQIEAIAAELRAAGYEVERDVGMDRILSQIGAPQEPGIRLDIVAWLPAPTGDGAEIRPGCLVVEIANRRRAKPPFGSRAHEHFTDANAVDRFTKISHAIAKHADVAFEIRFLDVSADQANARALRRTKPRAKAAMAEHVTEDRRLLDAAAVMPELAKALVIARLWSHWLRIAGYTYPAKEHRELKSADLRTIQKDLSDSKILTMGPSKYGRIHPQILAITEGGDLNIDRLVELEGELRLLLDWAAARYGVSPEPQRESLFVRLDREIISRAPEQDRRTLLASSSLLSLTRDDAQSFGRQLLAFQLQLIKSGQRDLLPNDLLEELLSRGLQA